MTVPRVGERVMVLSGSRPRGLVLEVIPSRQDRAPVIRVKLDQRIGFLDESVYRLDEVRVLTLIELIGELGKTGE